MGVFRYGSATLPSIDDRTLIHLEVVIGNKLRRGEAFMFTWVDTLLAAANSPQGLRLVPEPEAEAPAG